MGNATVRQRVWRGLKAMGACSLRDGVYAAPDRESCRATLQGLAKEVIGGGGSACIVTGELEDAGSVPALFDRSAEFAPVLRAVEQLRRSLDARPDLPAAQKQARKLRKTFDGVVAIDFFPGKAQAQVADALAELEHRIARLLTPDEPHASSGVIQPMRAADVRGRNWATRAAPWIDRLASAWLIRRFIDPDATILWLASPADCPVDALGFDFDGASFSHVGERVTFEVIAASFGLEGPAIQRLGQVVHFLDVGGLRPPEAPGVESILSGLRLQGGSDDELLASASAIFDGLLAHFERESATS